MKNERKRKVMIIMRMIITRQQQQEQRYTLVLMKSCRMETVRQYSNSLISVSGAID
jgi:hypothetical protein